MELNFSEEFTCLWKKSQVHNTDPRKSINACFNLERLNSSSRLARPEISALERLWNGFDSDAERFMSHT